MNLTIYIYLAIFFGAPTLAGLYLILMSQIRRQGGKRGN